MRLIDLSPIFFIVSIISPGYSAAGGLNPLDPGLPSAQAYSITLDNSNPDGDRPIAHRASSMCIDCHTANPKSEGGSHFVAHFDGSVVRPTVTTPTNTSYEKTTAWAGGAKFLSRYAVPAPPNTDSESVMGAIGAIICESCHNLIHNDSGGNNLLVRYRELEDPSTLCEGCHPTLASGPPAHHPLTGHVISTGCPSNAASHTLNTTHASVDRTGGTSPYDVTPLADSEVTFTTVNGAVGGAVVGVSCSSCHVPHGAQPQTGARILKRGWSPVPSEIIPNILSEPVNVTYYDNQPPDDVCPPPTTNCDAGDIVAWDTGNVVIGIDRQIDVDASFAPSGDGMPRLVYNRDPLCDGCHVYDDP